MSAESYLSPETLSQLAPFDLRARMIVDGIRSGSHQSPLQGMSVEFEQHRQYVPGDDLRHLDWKVYGRSDRLAIKQYEQLLRLTQTTGNVAGAQQANEHLETPLL